MTFIAMYASFAILLHKKKGPRACVEMTMCLAVQLLCGHVVVGVGWWHAWPVPNFFPFLNAPGQKNDLKVQVRACVRVHGIMLHCVLLYKCYAKDKRSLKGRH